MKVRANHQVAYDNKLYLPGDVFDMKPELLERYKSDVTVVSAVQHRNTKPVKNIRTK